MTHIHRPDDSEPTALAPDPSRLADRARRAWTERMAVTRREDDTYAVTTESGHTYRVDLRAHTCSCPDYRIRGERCKHLRRVAIEITARRVAPPGKERARCDACGAVTFVDRESEPPHRCRDCRLVTGDIVRDRETGERLVIVRVTDERADRVIEATYLTDAVRSESPRRYAFPRSRLARTDAELVD